MIEFMAALAATIERDRKCMLGWIWTMGEEFNVRLLVVDA